MIQMYALHFFMKNKETHKVATQVRNKNFTVYFSRSYFTS